MVLETTSKKLRRALCVLLETFKSFSNFSRKITYHFLKNVTNTPLKAFDQKKKKNR